MAIPISYNIRNLKLRKGLTVMTALGIALTVTTAIFLMALVAGLDRVGIWLSGGVDSAIVAALARQATDRPLETFYLRPPPAVRDSSAGAEAAAESPGVRRGDEHPGSFRSGAGRWRPEPREGERRYLQAYDVLSGKLTTLEEWFRKSAAALRPIAATTARGCSEPPDDWG